MTNPIHLAPGLDLPATAVTQTFGILAMRGAGKSNAAAVMAEQMYAADLPFVAVDPVGSWPGLRSSRDGKGPGLPIPIFGGRQGDVPLERGSGDLLADLIVEKRLSCVVDLSEFESEAAKKAFLLAFARRLYLKNTEPLHLFLEEADDYIPQRPMRDEAQLLRAFENIVRRGRARGLGITLITQRSASINKSVLTQIETLLVLRTTGPQDRKAIEEWVKYHDARAELVESLSGLKDGEAWCWSPHWLGKMVRVQVDRRKTFDSGATPKAGAARRPATLADVDLPKLSTEWASTIERAKADDPKELRRRIAELEKQVAAKPAAAPAKVERVEVPVLTKEETQTLNDVRLVIGSVLDGFKKLEALGNFAREMEAIWSRSGAPAAPIAHRDPKPLNGASKREPVIVSVPPVLAKLSQSNGATKLGPGELRLLEACAWMESIGQVDADTTAVAFLAGYTVNGHFNNMRGKLRSAGLLEYPGNGTTRLTEAGRLAAPHVARPHTLAALHQAVINRLDANMVKLFRPLIEAYPDSVTTERLAAASGYTVNRHFNNMKGRLRTLGLATYPRGNEIRAAALLFPEGIS